jgi:hypothetical protein
LAIYYCGHAFKPQVASAAFSRRNAAGSASPCAAADPAQSLGAMQEGKA